MTGVQRMPDGDLELGDFRFRRDPGWTNVVWVVTQQCNLRCDYCVGPDRRERSDLIGRLGARRVVDGFERLRAAAGRAIWITATGGEPTLVPGFPELACELTHRGFRLDLQTNLASPRAIEVIDAVSPDGVVQIEAAYHPAHEGRQGGGPWSHYVAALRRARARGVPCVMKVVATPARIPNLGRTLAELGRELPDDLPILVQSYIRGSPRSLRDRASAYPYAYSDEERRLLRPLLRVRRDTHLDYWKGAGFFRGMRCDAGHGMVVLDLAGRVGRCAPLLGCPDGILGRFIDGPLELLAGPRACPLDFCSCAQHGMWYGVDPWAFIPGGSREHAFYCRFGPDPGGGGGEARP